MSLPASSKPDFRSISVQKTEETCAALGHALDQGKLGDIVAKHETLILQYYRDVQEQARQSFLSAKSVAKVGFLVLASTLAYTLLFDALSRFHIAGPGMAASSLTAAQIGVVSGALIEFIAAVNFWLYAKGARQFSAFHICLERTHRYLLAYKIAEELEGDREATLQRLVCIMANAPMITSQDVGSSGGDGGKETKLAASAQEGYGPNWQPAA